jgi:hypothetical protein
VVGAWPGEVDGIVGQMLSMTVHRELEELWQRGSDGAIGVAVACSMHKTGISYQGGGSRAESKHDEVCEKCGSRRDRD